MVKRVVQEAVVQEVLEVAHAPEVSVNRVETGVQVDPATSQAFFASTRVEVVGVLSLLVQGALEGVALEVTVGG